MITTRDKILSAVTKPTRYTGGELNAVMKDPSDVDVRFGFCFADTYEIAMSHLGLKILYHDLNDRNDTYCERVFAPWTDMEEEMKKHGMRLFALETGDEVTHFDMLGFTLQYELCYSNIVNMLNLAEIPVRSSERDETYPLICGGGPCAYNAEPVADIFDFFMLGEGEDIINEVVDEYIRWKKSGKKNKRDFLENIAEIEGIYVPSFYDVEYNEDNTIKIITPNNIHAKPKVKKRIMTDFDGAYTPETIIVPFGEVVHDRVMLEVMRGCLRGCRFCQAGFIYRPIREKSSSTVNRQAKCLCDSTGYDEVSLCSLSTSDYTGIESLIPKMFEWALPEKINVALPSLRVDNFSEELMEELKKVRKSGLTFAPEAGTQRLRDAINKNVTEEEVLKTSAQAFRGGWTSVKLYFMMGLPTETLEDIAGIADLAQKVVNEFYKNPDKPKGKGVTVSISVASFVPKPFTPFQWEPQDTMEQLVLKQKHLMENVHTRKIQVSWHQSRTSFLEGVFARGDRKLCNVIESAWRKGCKFDGWDEYFLFDKWMEAFEENGIDPAFYSNRRRDFSEILPWDHLDYGIRKAFLEEENKKAHESVTTPHCRQKCAACGAAKLNGGQCDAK